MARGAHAVTLKDRLHACMRDGNLTVADLAYWLDRPDPTVRNWTNGTAMRGGAGDIEWVLAGLDLLETAIKRRRGFPVPPISLRKRKAYLEGAYKKAVRL